ncbi:MAG TPA: YlxR family protein [Ruminiclostridium sp.]|nr:YlxR family protein [Ruminiclostridium sp.]
MQKRKVPMRMCTGCGEMKPKKELVRIVRNAEGEISLDITGKKPGRGAYICKNPECLKKARKQKRLERAFSCAMPEEIYNRLEEELAADE